MIPLGVSFSASALTGNYMGEGKIHLAKTYAKMSILFSVVCTLSVAVLVYIEQESMLKLYTSDQTVLDLMLDLIPLFIAYIIADTIHGVQTGILKGIGLQLYGSIFAVCTHYLVGLPNAIYLGFSCNLGVKGLWYGMTVSQYIIGLGYAVIIFTRNWNTLALRLQQKIKNDQSKEVASDASTDESFEALEEADDRYR